MISMRELLGRDVNMADLPFDHERNLYELQKKINIIRSAYGKPMIVTSGYRTIYRHRLIYSKKGNLNPPMGSQHLKGNACDISDPDGALKEWILDNVALLEEVGLWCEDFDATPKWVHFQQVPPKSGKRFFKP